MSRAHFTDRQRVNLLERIHPSRIQNLDGVSHLAAWDVVAHLNRMFGFEGWDKEILSLEPVYEHVGQREVAVYRNGRKTDETKMVPACSVGYRCTMRLTVRNPDGETVRVIEDAAMGTATNQRDLGDAHDLAMKSAVSYALKRCAKDLGDQFGLSLYNKGQESACVGSVLPYLGESDEHHVEVNVQGDGISEGDGGFGDKRGDRSEPEAPQVREPAPARPKQAEKPEATAPEAKPEVPTLDATVQQTWVDTIRSVSDPDTLRQVWKDAQGEGVLDAQVNVEDAEGKGYTTTIREFVVARLNQIEEEAKSA